MAEQEHSSEELGAAEAEEFQPEMAAADPGGAAVRGGAEETDDLEPAVATVGRLEDLSSTGTLVQFHLDNGFAPPPMPALAHFVRKLKVLARFECDNGRAQQGAWTPDMIDEHFASIEKWKQEELQNGNMLEVEQLCEYEMAMSAAFEVAGRLGGFCKGDRWKCDAQNAWTKATLYWLLTADPRIWAAKGVLLPPIWTKTSGNESEAAREAARQSYLYLVKTNRRYGLIKLCRDNAKYRTDHACKGKADHEIPAFRNVYTGAALSYQDIFNFILKLERHNRQLPPGSTIGVKSIRKGRTQNCQVAADKGYGAVRGNNYRDTSAIRSMTTHTSESGVAPYTGTSLGGRVALVEQADRETYEGASEIFEFRDYHGGRAPLVLVVLRDGVMRSFVADDMDNMSNSDDDDAFQDGTAATEDGDDVAAAAAGDKPARSKLKLQKRTANTAAVTTGQPKRRKTAPLTGGTGATKAPKSDMTAKQRKLQAQAGSCANLNSMFKAAKTKATTPAAAAAASDGIQELDENDQPISAAAPAATGSGDRPATNWPGLPGDWRGDTREVYRAAFGGTAQPDMPFEWVVDTGECGKLDTESTPTAAVPTPTQTAAAQPTLTAAAPVEEAGPAGGTTQRRQAETSTPWTQMQI